MTLLLQQIVDGLVSGMVYGALALSMVLVYRTSRVINFAQVEMATLGAFLAWQLQVWGLPLFPSIGVAVAASFGFGALIERTLIRPLAHTSQLTVLIVTVGLLLVLINLEALIWGYQVKEFGMLAGGGSLSFGTVSISRQSLVIVAAVVVTAVVLWAGFAFTRIGLAMRASADNPVSARQHGLPTGKIMSLTWGAAAAIGTLMACLMAPQQFLQPGMLLPILLYSLAAAILGGLDSPLGAIVGGLIVGVVENLLATYVPGIGQDFKQAAAFAIIMIVLLFRSQGLFGAKGLVRV